MTRLINHLSENRDYVNMPMQYTATFFNCKNDIFSDEQNVIIFLFLAFFFFAKKTSRNWLQARLTVYPLQCGVVGV